MSDAFTPQQVRQAHLMVGLARRGGRGPHVPQPAWDALEKLSAGVPGDTLEKFSLWLEGTAHFFALLPGDKDCGPWVRDACRIARSLDPSNAPRPELPRPLRRDEALVELRGLSAWLKAAVRPAKTHSRKRRR